MSIIKTSSFSRVLYLLPVWAILLIGGCTKPQINFAVPFAGNTSSNIVVTDSFSVQQYTVKIDSFPTAASGNIFLGRYKDPQFGTIASGTFIQLGPPASIPTISNAAAYDSICIILFVNKAYYGDTTQVQRINVSQIKSPILYPGLQTTFYSNNTVPYYNSLLGSASVRISPTAQYTSQFAGDTVKIRLADTLGQTLFNYCYDKADTVTNPNAFISYFSGLHLYPDDNSQGAIYGFKDSLLMRVYYHSPGVITQQQFLDFRINNRSLQFNNITADRTGTPLQALDQLTHPSGSFTPLQIPSSQTNNASYVQSFTGLQTKLIFPSLAQLPLFPDYLGVLKAELIISPVAGSYSTTYPLPPQLVLGLTNQGNLIGSVQTVNGAAQYGNLQLDYLYGVNTNYSYDITAFVKNAVLSGYNNNQVNGLMLAVPSSSANKTLGRAVIGDATNNVNNKIILKIYYASYYDPANPNH